MILMALLVHVPKAALIAISLATIAGHNLLDAVQPEVFGPLAGLWHVLHVPGFAVPGRSGYSTVPDDRCAAAMYGTTTTATAPSTISTVRRSAAHAARHPGAQLMCKFPASIPSMKRSARPRSRVKIPADSPNGVLFASASASSIDVNAPMTTAGPNSSCFITFASGGTLVSSVGWCKDPE